MSLTAAQQEAIAARGNVLVIAGAGTGKTRTLVERCLDCLLHESPPASLDEILMLTFTDAAAAEMRQRIRARLEQESRDHPEVVRWQEQLALFENAHIGTLHGFCLELIREHFYELELDPQVTVLAPEEAKLLGHEALSSVLDGHYAGKNTASRAVQDLIQTQGRGWDKPIRALVLRLHEYTQTLPDPSGWFDEQLSMLAHNEPLVWRQWLLDEIGRWRDSWAAWLENCAAGNQLAMESRGLLTRLRPDLSRADLAALFGDISAIGKNCPPGQKTILFNPLEDFFKESEFLGSLTRIAENGVDPLSEDWGWVRSQMATLLHVAREFEQAFTEAKHELGVLDFHDLEQHALRLLWDPAKQKPTRTSAQWRKRFRFVFVDEYQDINAAQDKIIECLSRGGAQANRFLVGDVKQSIYRFRLANPYIFKTYAETWGKGSGTTIPLVENFRSRESILEFINALFGTVMRGDLGGVAYDREAHLRFGAATERASLSMGLEVAKCVEVHVRVKDSESAKEWDSEMSDALAEVIDLDEATKEARLVALRLRELRGSQYPVWDEAAKAFRPVEWRDMAILLRAPASKAEAYAKEFSRLNIPLLVTRGGFYQSVEISDLLSLLHLLDNPLQDVPLLAVLHSPLVGLTINELARIRLSGKGSFWNALTAWKPVQSAQAEVETFGKVNLFLRRYQTWRRLGRQVPLSRCLDAVLSETQYAAWLRAQPRGEQRYANLERLLYLTQRFDAFQRHGLFRFLRFIEAQQMAESQPDVAPVSAENCARLMSIHQSKGLEFPVVVVADLGKPFNTMDLNGEIILDDKYGLCPQIKPPHTGNRYPSLPHWLARRRQRQELLGEELRLLYVAMTRARDRLILSCTVSKSKMEKLWKQNGNVAATTIVSARNYADWLGYWFSENGGLGKDDATEGENRWLDWFLRDETKLIAAEPAPIESEIDTTLAVPAEIWKKLHARVSWAYQFNPATLKPAKTSVSVLRRNARWLADETTNFSGGESRFGSRSARKPIGSDPVISAAELGSAHHQFLQLVSLASVGSVQALKQEAERLVESECLTSEQAAMLDFKALASFWQSELGKKVLAQVQHVRRELAFTARFSCAELSALLGETTQESLKHEFVVVQGVADLVVLLPEELWLIDFKTDAINGGKQLAEKQKLYEPQLKLYAVALSRIYARPVCASWFYFLACGSACRVDSTLRSSPTRKI
jgi:ATP-dependent helicase/nuclease subunit A